jgi:hypothetical protein
MLTYFQIYIFKNDMFIGEDNRIYKYYSNTDEFKPYWNTTWKYVSREELEKLSSRKVATKFLDHNEY